MTEYQLLWDSETVLRLDDQAYIPPDPANRDRAEYEAWLAEGNKPYAAVSPGHPERQPLQLQAMPQEPMDATTKAWVENYVETSLAPLREMIADLDRRLRG